MATFFITTEQRRRAQNQAAALDVSKSNPAGTPPYVWDNRMGCVNRWYNYGSPEDKLGAIYFEPVFEADGRPSGVVECTTEITLHPLRPGRDPRQVTVVDTGEHERLIEFFFADLVLGDAPSNAAS